MYKNRSQGFTLIELLVVIAIIGILSAVVLASLSTARNKGSDAAIQSDLSTVQTQAEIYFGNTSNTYGATGQTPTGANNLNCASASNMFSDSNISKAMLGADAANGSGFIWCNVNATSPVSYAAQVQLINNTAKYWCVDSTGISKETSTQLGSSFVCL